eukprot:12386545-Alexandrium_andersonii.AAC.1
MDLGTLLAASGRAGFLRRAERPRVPSRRRARRGRRRERHESLVGPPCAAPGLGRRFRRPRSQVWSGVPTAAAARWASGRR